MGHQNSPNCHGGEGVDHWISELISRALIAPVGQFYCVFKTRHVAFLPYLVSQNTQRKSSFHVPPLTSFREMHHKGIS